MREKKNQKEMHIYFLTNSYNKFYIKFKKLKIFID